MNSFGFTWQDHVFECLTLDKNQQNFYGKNSSCLLKIDISTQVINLMEI